MVSHLAPLTELVLLGTSGGPRWRLGRFGIASAVVVGDATYLVDCGYGSPAATSWRPVP